MEEEAEARYETRSGPGRALSAATSGGRPHRAARLQLERGRSVARREARHRPQARAAGTRRAPQDAGRTGREVTLVSDLRSVLQERRRSYEPSPGGFDRLVRRRRRKQRNQRLAAGLVALVVMGRGPGGFSPPSRSLGPGRAAASIDGSTVHRLDVAWTAAVGDTPTPPVVGDNLVFVGSASGVLYAFDVEGGEVAWLGRLRGSIVSAPAVSGDEVVVHTTRGSWPRSRHLRDARRDLPPDVDGRTGDDAGSPPTSRAAWST